MILTRRGALALIGAMLGAACTPTPPQPTPTLSRPAATPAEQAEPATATTAPVVDTPEVTVGPTTTTPPPMTVPVPTPTPAPTLVLTGVDVLLQQRKEPFAGKRFGLVTNATGRTRSGQSTIDVLHAETAWQLVALFSPEHGIRGNVAAGQPIDESKDERTGLPIYSLYGNTTRPTDAMLRGLDVLVYDIQDVGARTYTYISTLLEVMRASAAQSMPVVVLDRPDPIGGDQVEGNVLDLQFASFVGPAPIAMRYGMTIGELAQFFNGELEVGADLTVVHMQGWQRSMWLDQTGLEWIDPSPNLRSLSAAALYPGTVLFEGTNVSEGRGTERPFEWIGAPWMNASAWADELNSGGAAGVEFTPADKIPDSSKFAGQVCHGVAITITDRDKLEPMRLGVTMLTAARAVAGNRMQLMAGTFDGLAGTDNIRTALESGQKAETIVAGWQADLQRFKAIRERYLIY